GAAEAVREVVVRADRELRGLARGEGACVVGDDIAVAVVVVDGDLRRLAADVLALDPRSAARGGDDAGDRERCRPAAGATRGAWASRHRPEPPCSLPPPATAGRHVFYSSRRRPRIRARI